MTNTIKLIHGDAMELLMQLEPDSVDIVLTDPPYTSGGEAGKRNKKGDGKLYTRKKYDENTKPFDDGMRDQVSHYFWTLEWMRKCHRVMKDSAWLMCFTDWRQLPLICTCVQNAGFRWEGINIWHKTNTRPNLKGFFRGDESSL